MELTKNEVPENNPHYTTVNIDNFPLEIWTTNYSELGLCQWSETYASGQRDDTSNNKLQGTLPQSLNRQSLDIRSQEIDWPEIL
ncbi:hypothetical protein AgCh_005441 [Apium graveolens]